MASYFLDKETVIVCYTIISVSYTHLDVYKRQEMRNTIVILVIQTEIV